MGNIVDFSPMVICVAPNGARRGKADHSEVPLTVRELVATALACREAGAAMMHFHVRDADGIHTLDPGLYQKALRELERAVGGDMLLQVSSESAGLYTAAQQIGLMKELAPHCLSCGLREFIPDRRSFDRGYKFFTQLGKTGALVQFIIYSPPDVQWYETLRAEGVIGADNHMLLFVLGSRMEPVTGAGDISAYLAQLKSSCPWMVCAFGREEHSAVAGAASLGGHARVGFENNIQLADGLVARDNAELVRFAVASARRVKRIPADAKFVRSLF